MSAERRLRQHAVQVQQNTTSLNTCLASKSKSASSAGGSPQLWLQCLPGMAKWVAYRSGLRLPGTADRALQNEGLLTWPLLCQRDHDFDIPHQQPRGWISIAPREGSNGTTPCGPRSQRGCALLRSGRPHIVIHEGGAQVRAAGWAGMGTVPVRHSNTPRNPARGCRTPGLLDLGSAYLLWGQQICSTHVHFPHQSWLRSWAVTLAQRRGLYCHPGSDLS